MKFTVSITEGAVTTTRELEWANAAVYNDSTTLAADIQTLADAVFGLNKVSVDGTGGKLTFNKGAGVDSLTLSESSNNNKVLGNLGFTSGDGNKLNLSYTMSKVSSMLSSGPITFNGDGKIVLNINGTENIEISSTDTLSTLISKVNSSSAGVTLSYSSYSDTFTLIKKDTGAGTITLNDNGSNFFSKVKQTVVTDGQDASFQLDGQAANRSKNTFLIDGVTYNLLKAAPGVQKTITLSRDTQGVFDSIKKFVDKYNEIIDTINSKISDKYDRDYQPLTDDQKSDMSEDDIKKWEEKAKTGLLHNDSILSNIVNNFRRASYDIVNGVSGGLASIGISTGRYEDKGKLSIDETKLKDAINNSPDKVMDLFSKESTTVYSSDLDSTSRTTRYTDNGFINRLNDIIQDNVRTSRDLHKKKGMLLEKAGITGDMSEYTNIIFNEIVGYNKSISDLNVKITNKETSYYKRFSAMETAISKMNAQSSAFTSQLG